MNPAAEDATASPLDTVEGFRPDALTKTEEAFLRVREAIESGRLAPGTRLVVRELVEWIGMSPTPIREALRLLQAQGLIEHLPRRGMIVVEYPLDQTTEIYRIRAELEPLAAELAVMQATPDDLVRIRDAHERFRMAITGSEAHPDAAALNAAWHRAVFRSARSRLLSELIERVWSGMPVEAVWLDRRALASLEHHEAITEAIENRDANLARRFMSVHIETGAISTVSHMRDVGHRHSSLTPQATTQEMEEGAR
jgi:DNA-binding GntR family transcriptional regulator